ncbi:unnamed protein product [Parascedosporium putredinis]|uniref:Uncharacterized protein n=1 Tax=Parascedosporium putredinis TaxID=1442378 RepID=A0A9P1GZX6_9PEZI|nr:unnamed protein product [Parascedosporium putredinis]CAI7992266.1 unnamed protein product [Parascedosporium putredinis]
MHHSPTDDMAGLLNPSKKHAREELEDPAAYGSSSFGEHRNKRIMSGTIESAKRWSGPPAFPTTTSLFLDTSGVGNAVSQDDMYMDMDLQCPEPNEQFQSILEPGPFHPEPLAANLAGARADLHRPKGINSMPNHGFGHPVAPDQAVPRTMGSDDWSSVRNRRLPSPISEGEDSPFIHPVGADSPDMVLDSGFTTNLAHRLASQVSISTPCDVGQDPMANVHPEHMQSGAGADLPGTIDLADIPTTPPQGRKGHIRSRHTINSWTWQPGMKKSFSMGYRTDCEKCRLKVPGHFNHIIIS